MSFGGSQCRYCWCGMDGLEFLDIGWGGVRKPNWGGVGEDGFNEGSVGLEHDFFLVPTGSAGNGFGEVVSGGGSGSN